MTQASAGDDSSFVREFDLAAIIHVDDDDFDRLADLHDVRDAVDITFGEFGDVAHAVGAGLTWGAALTGFLASPESRMG